MVFATMLDVPAWHLDDPVILINFLLALLVPGAVNALAFFLFPFVTFGKEEQSSTRLHVKLSKLIPFL